MAHLSLLTWPYSGEVAKAFCQRLLDHVVPGGEWHGLAAFLFSVHCYSSWCLRSCFLSQQDLKVFKFVLNYEFLWGRTHSLYILSPSAGPAQCMGQLEFNQHLLNCTEQRDESFLIFQQSPLWFLCLPQQIMSFCTHKEGRKFQPCPFYQVLSPCGAFMDFLIVPYSVCYPWLWVCS